MHPKIAFLILSAFAAMTMAAPQNPTETPADVEGAITAQDIAQALPVGTVHQLADGEPEVSIAAVERTHVKVCKDINFRGRCETLTANKQRCCESFPFLSIKNSRSREHDHTPKLTARCCLCQTIFSMAGAMRSPPSDPSAELLALSTSKLPRFPVSLPFVGFQWITLC